VGGQGAPEDVPGCDSVPGVDDEPDDDPEEDPVPGVEPLEAPGVPGAVPQGPPDLLPGVVFGFMVEGSVVLPGVGGLVEFEPGTVPGAFGVGLGVVGVAVPPGGGEGVAAPGVWDCPALPAPLLPAPGAAPPEGAACAITQQAQNRINKRKVSFVAGRLTAIVADIVADIEKASCSAFSGPFYCKLSLVKEFILSGVCDKQRE
jgi:hypothetical protein